MKVSLFVTCLVDQMWTSIGLSSVEVLRRVGCEVEFDRRQTCCAQPAYNTGYLKHEPRTLIRNVRGAEFVELEHADACCGFGGTFSVKYPEISLAILDQKIDAIERAGVQAVVSGDASCLMQIGGRLSRKGSKVRVMHLAELLSNTDERGS